MGGEGAPGSTRDSADSISKIAEEIRQFKLTEDIKFTPAEIYTDPEARKAMGEYGGAETVANAFRRIWDRLSRVELLQRSGQEHKLSAGEVERTRKALLLAKQIQNFQKKGSLGAKEIDIILTNFLVEELETQIAPRAQAPWVGADTKKNMDLTVSNINEMFAQGTINGGKTKAPDHVRAYPSAWIERNIEEAEYLLHLDEMNELDRRWKEGLTTRKEGQ